MPWNSPPPSLTKSTVTHGPVNRLQLPPLLTTFPRKKKSGRREGEMKKMLRNEPLSSTELLDFGAWVNARPYSDAGSLLNRLPLCFSALDFAFSTINFIFSQWLLVYITNILSIGKG